MILSILVFLFSAFGISLFAVVIGKGIYQRLEYARGRANFFTGIFLGLICAALNASSLVIESSPVMSAKTLYLIAAFSSFDLSALLVMGPFYIAAVLLSGFSPFFGIGYYLLLLLIRALIKNRNIALFLFVFSVIPLSLSEVIVCSYLPAFDARILWTVGLALQFIISLTAAAVIFSTKPGIRDVLSAYFNMITGVFSYIHFFLIDDKRDAVHMTAGMTDYYEFPSAEMSVSDYDRIVRSASGKKIGAYSNAEGLFTTAATLKVYYVKYGCHTLPFHRNAGFIYDITNTVPRPELLYSSMQRDSQTGLPTYKSFCGYLSGQLADPLKYILFAVIIPRPNILGISVYDVEFEIKCQRAVIAKLADEIPNGEMLCISGGEYILIVPDLPSERETVRQSETIYGLLGRELTVDDKTVSLDSFVGILTEKSGRIGNQDGCRLMEKKLMFCLAALKSGKFGSRYLFSNDDYEEYRSRIQRTRYLEDIFKNEKIDLTYQPIVSTGTGKAEFYEVLARIRHDVYRDTGLFIEDCINQGVEKEVDDLIFKKLRGKLEDGKASPLNYSVNIMGNTPISEDILFVADFLYARGAHLSLEITEKTKLSEKLLEDRVEKAKRHHIELIADDYGCNYTNLETLYKIRFDMVKIPRVFVSNVGSDKKRRVFVNNIVKLCRQYGMQCAAIGVENEAELAALCNLGVEYVQGYYCAAPLEQIPGTDDVYIQILRGQTIPEDGEQTE